MEDLSDREAQEGDQMVEEVISYFIQAINDPKYSWDWQKTVGITAACSAIATMVATIAVEEESDYDKAQDYVLECLGRCLLEHGEDIKRTIEKERNERSS